MNFRRGKCDKLNLDGKPAPNPLDNFFGYREWVYGGIVHQTDFYGVIVDSYFIIDGTTTQDYNMGDNTEVIPNTVGQYTGLKDKNGKEIYEGDILEDKEIRIKVLYELDGFYGQIIKLKKMCGTEVGLKYHLSFFQDDGNDLEVVGNIYDNPELLKE